tara:strand:- start:334 stop:528 length:195 start_codon:yes stop_codon:yes gene_type:complete
MNSTEATNLIQVMNNRINQLTQQNLLLEAKVLELTSKLEQEDDFENEKPLEKTRNGKTSNKSTT